MTEILKKRWKHDGFIVSDWGAVEQLKNQGLAATKKDAARYAFNAGLEMDMMSHAYDRHLKELVEEGKVTMAQVDESVRRVLRVNSVWVCSNVLILRLLMRRIVFSVRKVWLWPLNWQQNQWCC